MGSGRGRSGLSGEGRVPTHQSTLESVMPSSERTVTDWRAVQAACERHLGFEGWGG